MLNNAYSDVVGNSYNYMKNVWTSYYAKDSKLKKYDLDILYTYNGGKGAGRVSVTDSAFGWYEATDDRYSEYAVKKYYIFQCVCVTVCVSFIVCFFCCRILWKR